MTLRSRCIAFLLGCAGLCAVATSTRAAAATNAPGVPTNAGCLDCHAAGKYHAPKVHADIASRPHADKLAAVDRGACHAQAYQSDLWTRDGQTAPLGLQAAPGCATVTATIA
jgi:hypothetical protein